MNVNKLLDTLSAKGFYPKLTYGNREIVITCPICVDNRTRLYISAESGAYYCFNCTAKGSLWKLLKDVCGMDEWTAQQMGRKIKKDVIEEELNLLPSSPKIEEEVRPIEPPEGLLLLENEWDNTRGFPFVEYLERRGITRELVVKYKIGAINLGPLAGRVVIPVFTDGVLQTWVARAIYPGIEPKVFNAPNSRASQSLFNIDNLKPPDVILTEGIFDALRSPTTMAATLGARLTDWQRRYLRKQRFKNVILLRDADKAGKEAATKESAELVATGFRVSIASLPDGMDPGNVSDFVLAEAIKNAQPVTQTYSQTLLKGQEERRRMSVEED